jgi:hypothetical protein
MLRRYIPEDMPDLNHCSENLKFYVSSMDFQLQFQDIRRNKAKGLFLDAYFLTTAITGCRSLLGTSRVVRRKIVLSGLYNTFTEKFLFLLAVFLALSSPTPMQPFL